LQWLYKCLFTPKSDPIKEAATAAVKDGKPLTTTSNPAAGATTTATA